MRNLAIASLYVFVRSFLVRLFSFVLLWWALTEGDFRGAWVALIFIAGGTLASYVLVPPNTGPWRVVPLVRFVAFFLRQSVIGGIDVSRRALDPRLPIAPAFVTYELRFTHTPAVVLLLDTVSLLPGTVGTDLQGAQLTVHALDKRLPVRQTIANLEVRIADMFGLDVSPSKEP